MSPVFSCRKQKIKNKEGKKSQDRYNDMPREDVTGMKACHFVRDVHEMPPFLFFENRCCQNLKDILFLFCSTTRDRKEL